MTHPYSLLAELTYRCPLRCPYCSNPLKLRQYANELDAATWGRVLAEAAELGVVQVHFSGGEPLLRRDFVEIVAAASRADLYSHLSTSGVGGADDTFRQLRDAGLDAVQISLQDSDPVGNKLVAGMECFEQKRQAVATAKKLDFPVTLNVVLHRQNLDRLTDVIALACDWNVDRIELAHVQYTGWAFRNRSALLPTKSQLDQAIDVVAAARESIGNRPELVHVLPDYFQQYPKPCLNGWGRVMLSINPDGAVLPCQTAREIPGLEFPNVRDASLREIWFDSAVFRRFRGTDWMPEPCRSCDRREIDFGGCRCQAFLVTGDVGATDPVCHLSPQRHLIDTALAEVEFASDEFEYRTMAK